jgi:hypothetical protein
MPLFCGPRGRMLPSPGAEVCIIGLAIVAMIDFSPWSGGILWCLPALCRALRTPKGLCWIAGWISSGALFGVSTMVI